MLLTLTPDPVTLVLALLVVVGVLLSPARTVVTRRAGPVSRPLAGLALLAAVALVPYALDAAAAAQRHGSSLNAELVGCGATVWALALLAVVSVAAVRARGWQLPALAAAAAAGAMGVAGVLWPDSPPAWGSSAASRR